MAWLICPFNSTFHTPVINISKFSFQSFCAAEKVYSKENLEEQKKNLWRILKGILSKNHCVKVINLESLRALQ